MLEIVTLAVLVYSGAGADPEAAATARAALVALLPEQTRVVDHALDAAKAARAAGWRSVDELRFLTEGRAALAAGRRARERVEHEEAARQLGLAEAAFEQGLMYAGVASLAGEAALEHGVTLAELGRIDDARLALRRALALWAGAQLTEKLARPDVVRLFREVHKTRVAPADLPAATDGMAERLEHLRQAPAAELLLPLADSLGADSVLVAYTSKDARRLLVTRAHDGCLSRVIEVELTDREQSRRAIASLVDAPCATKTLGLSSEDPRLEPPPVAIAAPVVVKTVPKRKPRVWPFALAGALGLAAAIVGVTVGFVASDARYSLKVDASAFSGR